MNEIKQLLQKHNLTGLARVFLMSLTAGFLMVILPSLGLNKLLPELGILNAKIANPMPFAKDPFENIYPKLEAKDNNYSLQKEAPTVLAATAIAADYEYNQLNAYAVIDFNSGKVIESKNLSEEVSVASLTKIMTAVVALDLSHPTDIFTISEKAEAMIPTKIGVVTGQKMTLEELLNAAILTSANDAVQAIKEGVDTQYGSEIFIKAMNEKAKFLKLSHTNFNNPQGFDANDAVQAIREGVDTQYGSEIFIKAMNEKAKFLKLSHTNFNNPQGFDANDHYSTAEDLAILTHYALVNYPLIDELSKKEYAFLKESSNHKQFDLYNWNGLLGVYPGASGVKIGNTGNAQKTTIVTAEREGKKILVVVLGAPSVLDRDMWAAELLDLGFEEEYGLKPVKITKEQLKEKYKTWKYWTE